MGAEGGVGLEEGGTRGCWNTCERGSRPAAPTVRLAPPHADPSPATPRRPRLLRHLLKPVLLFFEPLSHWG